MEFPIEVRRLREIPQVRFLLLPWHSQRHAMKIARILPVVLVPLLVVLASCGGGGGNGGAKNATLTGSVAGTTVVVYDSGGAKVAEAVATGTSGKSFSVTLPVRRTYAHAMPA